MMLTKWRREAEEEEQILQPIPIEECWWNFFAEEIFHRLPANQLQTIKGVCRNWFRTISSPNFVGLHLKIYHESRIRVVVKNYGRMIEYKFNIKSSNLEETKQLPCPCPPEIRSSSIRSSLLGSCDGLLCFHIRGDSSRSIGLYNPSTGNYFRPKSSLIDNNYYVNCSWFGHHPCSGEYVLVFGSFYGELIGVYKLNSRSNLRKIHSTTCSIDPQVYFSFHERIGTLLHGAIHWSAQRNPRRGHSLRRQVIYAYHLDDNKYLEISPPVQPLRHFNLGVVDGCLFAIFRLTIDVEFEMWIMKEYGVQQSWTKYANIQGFNSYRMLSPLGFFPNGDLILDVGDLILDVGDLGDLMLNVDECKLIKYSFNDKRHVLLMNHRFGVPIMCVDSLVSPKIVGT